MKKLLGILVIVAIAAALYSLRGEAALPSYDYTITCEPPTKRIDDTPLLNLHHYTIEYGICGEPNPVESIDEPAGECSFVVPAPRGSWCWSMKAVDTDGLTSEPSTPVVFFSTTDTDEDGIPDYADNCIFLANPTQVDSDVDGYGNRCDGDLDGNHFTNAFDTVLFRRQLGMPSDGPVYNPADINANGVVNSQDAVLFRQLLGSPPGPKAY